MVSQDSEIGDPHGGGLGQTIPIQAGQGALEYATIIQGSPYFFATHDLNLTERQVHALPADPGRLKAVIMAGYKDFKDSGAGSIDSYLFSVIPTMFTWPVTPQVRSALYQILAGQPDVQSLGTVQDVAGQTGLAVAVTGNYSQCGDQGILSGSSSPPAFEMSPLFASCGVQQELVINPVTGLPMAMELRYTRLPAGQSWSAPGGLFSYEIYGAPHWTNASPPRA